MEKVFITRRYLKVQRHVVKIPYCDAYYLLSSAEPWGYNRGVYGWNYDVYEFGDVYIVTGYRMDVKGEYRRELVHKYETKAREIHDDDTKTWTEKMAEITTLRNEFLDIVRG